MSHDGADTSFMSFYSLFFCFLIFYINYLFKIEFMQNCIKVDGKFLVMCAVLPDTEIIALMP